MSERNGTPTAPVGEEVGAALQRILVAILHLQLQVKHAHWNVYGAGFRDLHRHLDEIAALLQDASDELAEREVVLGSSPDGRLEALVELKPVNDLAEGPLLVDHVMGFVAAQLDQVAGLARERMELLDSLDPVSMDLVVGIVGRLEKERWLLIADFSSSAPARPVR